MGSAVAPTMRSLAAEAGVSSMTVSLALRNHPKISVETRQRIQRLARERGYRPDPNIARLMSNLATQRTKRMQAVICALTTHANPPERSALLRIAAGARRRAEELGFGFDRIDLTAYLEKPILLQRVLRSRGVQGLLFLPMYAPLACDHLLDWRDFSIVATTHSVLSPEFCRVLPDQFNNLMLVCRKLTARGFRRIGLAIAWETEFRVRHNFTAALTWHNSYGGTEAVKPLLTTTLTDEEAVQWLLAERPDVVVTSDLKTFEAALRRPELSKLGRVELVHVSYGEGYCLGGVDERGEEVGQTAVDLISAMILRGEKGVPDIPKNMLVQGVWVDGAPPLVSQPAGNALPRRRAERKR